MTDDRTFDGTDFVEDRDHKRLSTQHYKVRDAAINWPGGWFTMYDLALAVDEPAASVERQVRYLRAKRFGGFYVAKRHVKGGTFEYRVTTEPDSKVVIVED